MMYPETDDKHHEILNHSESDNDVTVHLSDTHHALYETVIDHLQTVYDPEVPLIDIYTLGLIYGVTFDDKEQIVHIAMTFTTPACPMGDLLKSMTNDAIILACPGYTCEILVSFDPMWTASMIRDEDLQRMFL